MLEPFIETVIPKDIIIYQFIRCSIFYTMLQTSSILFALDNPVHSYSVCVLWSVNDFLLGFPPREQTCLITHSHLAYKHFISFYFILLTLQFEISSKSIANQILFLNPSLRASDTNSSQDFAPRITI